MRRIYQNLKIFVIIFLNIVDIIMIPILTKLLSIISTKTGLKNQLLVTLIMEFMYIKNSKKLWDF